jgi:hypothetical protein
MAGLESQIAGRRRLEGFATSAENPVDRMHRLLEEWVPEGSKVYGPTFPPNSREFIRWRVDFPDGAMARVSFRATDVENAQDAIWETIRDKSLLRGGSGSFRVEPGTVIGNPWEWEVGSGRY